jgi:hypothetical protein
MLTRYWFRVKVSWVTFAAGSLDGFTVNTSSSSGPAPQPVDQMVAGSGRYSNGSPTCPVPETGVSSV